MTKSVSVKVRRRTSVVKGKRTALFLQVIYDRIMKRAVLEMEVSEDEWQEDTESIIIPPKTDNRRIAELMLARETLCRNLQDMNTVISQLIGKKECSSEKIVEDFSHYNRDVMWLEYVLAVIEKKKACRSDATVRNYQSTYKTFHKFCGGKDIPIKEVDENLILAFESYLIEKGASQNTAALHCRNLKHIWNFALKENVVAPCPDPFRNVCTHIGKTEKRAIKEKYIHKLEDLNEENAPGLDLARDLFLICYYFCGMAFIDLAHLTPANIRGRYLVYRRKKTGQEIKIKLLPLMLKIIQKYRQPGQYYLFPILTNPDASWKEYDSALRLQNKRLKVIGAQIGVHLSTYVARHSWASIAKEKGVSEDVISECMGHTSLHTTRIYIAQLSNTRQDDANKTVVMGKSR